MNQKQRLQLLCILIISLFISNSATEVGAKAAASDSTTELQSIQSVQSVARPSRKVQASKSKHYNKKNIRLLSSIIYCEAGNQPYSGKLAVAIVVMNRVRSSSYPNTVKGVIYQKSQFGPASSGLLKKAMQDYKAGGFTTKEKKQCIRAAKQALNGVKSITVKNKRKVFSNYYGFNNVKPSCSFYKLGGHYFRK